MINLVAEKIDTDAIKAAYSVAELAERYTTLRRESAAESAGPCPKCGGDDRFHCTDDWFFCRTCHEERGDVIEMVQWIVGCSFVDACNRLTVGGLPQRRQIERSAKKVDEWKSPHWQEHAKRIVSEATDRLWSDEGEPGRDYLVSRGLDSSTWLTFGLGYGVASLPGTEGKQKAPAAVIPWIVAGQIRAIRYRFTEPQSYTDIKGNERTEKQTALYGSSFGGVLFGGHAIAESTNKTLVLCEGEINAMSVFQIAHHVGVDVLSAGSERHTITPAMVDTITERYKTIICWFDKPEIARRARDQFPAAVGMKSPGGQDANDLLKAGQLGGVLTLVRWNATEDTKLVDLLAELLAGACTWNGVDEITAKSIMRLAGSIGVAVQFAMSRPGIWTAERKL